MRLFKSACGSAMVLGLFLGWGAVYLSDVIAGGFFSILIWRLI